MISKNAIFVVGAGSSREYDYPVWKELKPAIQKFLTEDEFSSDPLAIEALEWLKEVTDTKTLDQVISEKNKIIKYKNDPSEVEAFIWVAIASLFLDLEKNVIAEDKKGWIDCFVQDVVNKITASYQNGDEDWPDRIMAATTDIFESIFFITYNYDRLLEFKIWSNLYEALRRDVNNNNQFNNRVKQKLISFFKDRFFHPHGIINPYPELEDNSVIDKARNSSNIDHFGEATGRIIQFAPGLMGSCFDCNEGFGSFAELAERHLQPDEVYILGNSPYGLSNNLKKLPVKEWAGSILKVYCTSYDAADQDTYRHIIEDCFGKQMDIEFFKTCTDFISKKLA